MRTKASISWDLLSFGIIFPGFIISCPVVKSTNKSRHGQTPPSYCENLRTYCVRFCTNIEINSRCEKHFFIGSIQFQTIYTHLLRIVENVVNYAFSGEIFCQKNYGRVIVLTNNRGTDAMSTGVIKSQPKIK